MPRTEPTPEDLLLDLHLDRLNHEERSWVENALRSDEALRAKSEQLGLVLQPLDHWTAAPPVNLADRVLSYVAKECAAATMVRPTSPANPRGRAPFVSLRDLVAVAACLALMVGVLVPGLSSLRDHSQRARCASNLGSIFRGTATYQAAFGGSLPFAGGPRQTAWLPEGADRRPYASNSRHVYLTVKGRFGPRVADFVCPGCVTHEPMRNEDVDRYDDFARASDVSYSFANLSGATPNLHPRRSVAYAADHNPLFVDGHFDASVNADTANSPAHRGKGQKVLALDGSVEWLTSPTFGEDQDNLWLTGNLRTYKGIETPVDENDVHLVPGIPSTDPVLGASTKRLITKP